MNLTYKVVENGYEIYSDGQLWITQYEPYIPNKSLSYEENAKAQIAELTTIPEKSADLEDLTSRVEELETALVELATLYAEAERRR